MELAVESMRTVLVKLVVGDAVWLNGAGLRREAVVQGVTRSGLQRVLVETEDGLRHDVARGRITSR
jgi:hypothetical protein